MEIFFSVLAAILLYKVVCWLASDKRTEQQKQIDYILMKHEASVKANKKSKLWVRR